MIGTVAALAGDAERRGEPDDDEREEPTRVVVSQQVPSVFDSFRRGK